MSDTSFVGRDLSGQDLRGLDFSDKILFGVDLRGAQLRGMKISLDCSTFDAVKVDDGQVAVLLMMIHGMDMSASWREGIAKLVLSVLGQDRYAALMRYLQVV